MSGTLDPRKVKKNRSYTVKMVAALFDVHINTVRRWIRDESLPVLKDGRGMMIHWRDLKDWITARNERRKWVAAKPDQMPCLTCKAHKCVKPGTFKIIKSNTLNMTLRGDCAGCGKTIHRFDNAANLDAINQAFRPKRPKSQRVIIAPIGDVPPPVKESLSCPNNQGESHPRQNRL